jgi:sister-chromatid-cohesion protein PDS5
MDVVQAIIGACKRNFAGVPTELLDCVRERTLDKKFKIRKEALVGLGHIYKRCCDRDNSDDIERISWVRNKVLHAYYHNAVDDKILVERILNTSLVPFSLDVNERMKRLFTLYANLDEHAVKALQEIFKTQLGLRTVMKSMLEPLQRGDKDETMITSKLVIISRNLPEPLKAQEHLKKFVKIVIDDVRIRGQLLKVTSPDCECKKAEEAVKDILKKLGNPVPQNSLYMTVKSLLERMAPVLIDGFAVVSLLKLVDSSIKSKLGDETLDVTVDIPKAVESGMKLLLLLSSVYPVCFQQGSVYEILLTFFQHDDDKVVEGTLQIFKNIGQLIEVTHQPIFSKLLPILTNLVKTGSPKHAKYAIRCIDCICKSKETVFKQLYEHLETKMDLESPNLLTALVAIGHLAQLSPALFASCTHSLVSRFVVKELLMQVRTAGRKSAAAWCADHLVSDETLTI